MSLWGHRDFRLLWASDTISQFGTFIGHTVLPLLAVSALAVSPFEMGLLGAAETVAFLLIGLPAGAWVDRMRRRPLMMRADWLRAALILSVPVAGWFGVLTLTQLIVVALFVGVCTVFFDVSYMAYMPSLVDKDQLIEGNAKLQASQSVAQVAGPAMGGGLIQLAGAANAVTSVGLGYVASALFLSRIRKQEQPPDPVPDRRLGREIVEGLRFVFGHPSIRAIALCGSTAGFFYCVHLAVLILFLSHDLGLSAGEVGLVMAASGVGGALGALTAGRWYQRFGQARSTWLPLLFTTPFLLLVPLAEPGWGVALAVIGVFAEAYGVIVHNIAQVSFRQAACPERLLGRMNASMRFMIWGAFPLGNLVGGALGELIGLRGTLWLGAAGLCLSVLWLLFSPLRHKATTPTPTTADPADHEQPAPRAQ